MMTDADVVVIGAGAAGLNAALAAADRGARVVVISKGVFGTGSTPWAQGGLAACLAGDDSREQHAADTRVAGGGLNDESAVTELTTGAPRDVERLVRMGAHFDIDDSGELALGREGGHTRNRVVHAGGDASGAEVARALQHAARRDSRITFVEPAVALDIVQDPRGVSGVVIGLVRGNDELLEVTTLRTRAVVLATGGAGQVYATTTNPTGSTGDGLALAVRAGAVVADMEFVQFHPTVLWAEHGAGQQALITEALRGAGATLTDDDGNRFMVPVHPMGELAPRDVVAAAIHEVMAVQGVQHVWLDATRLEGGNIATRFPTVTAACRAAGIDPVTDRIPVAPGAHYFCGGVRTDLFGRTTVPGMMAAGEVACTGVHGANRLASNSLTEALHFGRSAGVAAADGAGALRWNTGDPVQVMINLERGTPDTGARRIIRSVMSSDCGITRDATGLARALRVLAEIPCPNNRLTVASVETSSMLTTAQLVAAAAQMRQESRGCHRRSDFADTHSAWSRHISLSGRDVTVGQAISA
jgi:L-aspartate oxidase